MVMLHLIFTGGSHSSDFLHADSKQKEMKDAIKEITKKLDTWLK